MLKELMNAAIGQPNMSACWALKIEKSSMAIWGFFTVFNLFDAGRGKFNLPSKTNYRFQYKSEIHDG
jgi:hypothetical protein